MTALAGRLAHHERRAERIAQLAGECRCAQCRGRMVHLSAYDYHRGAADALREAQAIEVRKALQGITAAQRLIEDGIRRPSETDLRMALGALDAAREWLTS